MLLDQEGSWLVLFLREGDELSELLWGWLLSVVDSVSIDDDVLSEVLVGVESVVVRRRWLVDGPVVERWVNNGVLSFGLY